MSDFYFPRESAESGITQQIGPGQGGLNLLSLSIIRMDAASRVVQFESAESEVVIDILGGSCTAHITTESGPLHFAHLGSRPNVFAGPPTMIYVPRRASVSLHLESEEFEAALASAPARTDHPPAVSYPHE